MLSGALWLCWPVLVPPTSSQERCEIFTVAPREAAASPRPSPKVNSGVGGGRHWPVATSPSPSTQEQTPTVHSTADHRGGHAGAKIGTGSWHGTRLCAVGRVSVHHEWREGGLSIAGTPTFPEDHLSSMSSRGPHGRAPALTSFVSPSLCHPRPSQGLRPSTPNQPDMPP